MTAMGGPPSSQQVAYPTNLPFRIVSKTIGCGAYATIKKACPLNQPKPLIAVKFIHKPHAFRAGRLRPKQLDLELSLHKSVSRHPNIITFIASGSDSQWVWMALELAEGGDLFDKIEADEGCGEDVAHLYFVQLVNALAFCHEQGVAHRDVKPENMLLGRDGDLKVADFGLATQFRASGGREKRCGMVCGSPPYIAPEILEVGEGNLKRKARGEEAVEGYRPDVADVWSAAIVLFVLLAGNTPWDSPNKKESYEFYDYVQSGGQPQDELWRKIPAQALGLVTGMLNVRPEERMTVEQVRAHAWYQRKNEQLGANGLVANPVNLATQMLEALRIDFNAHVPASQERNSSQRPPSSTTPTTTTTTTTTTAMDLDTPTPTATQQDWEPPPRSQQQPPPSSQLLTTPEILAALSTDPSQTQITRLPVSQMTATQQARAFNDIVPAYSLTRFYSHYPISRLLPLLTTSLDHLGFTHQVQGPGEEEGAVDIWITGPDARREALVGTVRVEVVAVEAARVVECRFMKAKGDPVGWRRLFKQVAVLCREAIPRVEG